jgi:hypothetical protein
MISAMRFASLSSVTDQTSKKLVAVVVSVLFPIAATLMELAKTLVADLHFIVHSTDKRSGIYLPVLRVSTKPIPCKGDFDCFVLGGRFGQKIGFVIANFKHVITLLFVLDAKRAGLSESRSPPFKRNCECTKGTKPFRYGCYLSYNTYSMPFAFFGKKKVAAPSIGSDKIICY